MCMLVTSFKWLHQSHTLLYNRQIRRSQFGDADNISDYLMSANHNSLIVVI